MNSRIALTTLAAALVVLTACSGSTDGEAKPALDTSSSASNESTSPTSANSPTSTKGNDSLDHTDPCSLLSKSEAEQVMGPLNKEPALEKLGSARNCAFSPKLASLSVGIRTSAGLAGVQPNGGEVKNITIGGHQAKQLVDSTGSCGIYLGVTLSSRVEVVLNTGPNADPCPLALRVAELVEPRLP